MKAKTTKTTKSNNKDFAKDLTNKIIDMINSGKTSEWIKAWAESPAPHNPVTGSKYSGVNWLALQMALREKDQFNGTSSEWVTYKQAQKLSGEVYPFKDGINMKGRGVPIIRVGMYTKTVQDNNGKDVDRNFKFMKGFIVFNADFVKNYETKQPKTMNSFMRADYIEAFINRQKADIVEQGDKAFYAPMFDQIQVPNLERFNSLEDYYATLLHELVHWTSHKDRLGRNFDKKFDGDSMQSYAFEELVAELGSAMLCSKLGIEGKLQHENYLASWLKILKSDTKHIISASKYAYEAMEFILARGEYTKYFEEEALLSKKDLHDVARIPC